MSSAQEVGQIFATAESPHGPATALLRSPMVIILSIGLWAMNVYLFDLFGIDYKRALKVSPSSSSSASEASLIINNSIHTSASSGGMNASSSNGNGGETSSVIVCSNDMKKVASKRSLDQASNDDLEQFSSSSSKDKDKDPLSNVANGELDKDVTAGKLLFLCFMLLILLHFSTEAMLHICGGNSFQAIVTFYILCTITFTVTKTRPDWLLTAVVFVFDRIKVLLTPRWGEIPRKTPFLDVFFADAMCSMSKVFFDWGLLWTMFYYYPNAIPSTLSSIALPSILSSIPYIIRARQCIVSYYAGVRKKDLKRFDNIFNAVKYSTSLFPICLSAYQKTLSAEEAHDFDALFVVLLIINSVYCYTWDVVMDWGMAQQVAQPLCSVKSPGDTSCQSTILRARLRFGFPLSFGIMITNFILRFSWMLRFYHEQIFQSFDSFVLATQFLEVFRRALWNLLRVEWELIKNSPPLAKGKEFDPIVYNVEMGTTISPTNLNKA